MSNEKFNENEHPIFATIYNGNFCKYFPREKGSSCVTGVINNGTYFDECDYIFDFTSIDNDSDFINDISELKYYSTFGNKSFNDFLEKYKGFLI